MHTCIHIGSISYLLSLHIIPSPHTAPFSLPAVPYPLSPPPLPSPSSTGPSLHTSPHTRSSQTQLYCGLGPPTLEAGHVRNNAADIRKS
jgi:hypothetical protein